MVQAGYFGCTLDQCYGYVFACGNMKNKAKIKGTHEIIKACLILCYIILHQSLQWLPWDFCVFYVLWNILDQLGIIFFYK